MWKLFLAICIACCLVTIVPAQRQKRRAGILINKNKPAVFVTYLRSAELEPLSASRERKFLLFRFTNNTRWSLWLQMSGVPKEHGDVGLYYAVESEEGTVKHGSIKCHVCSINPLGSGRSIVFSVPADYISYDTRMRIAYSFDWEYENELDNGSNSTHSVEYLFNNLSESVLPKEKTSIKSF